MIWIITEFCINIGLKSKLNGLRTEIAKNRDIECEGFANYNNRRGYLFLTKSALEFYYSKSKPDLNNFYILLENIKSVYVKGNFFLGEKLTIKTQDEQISFLVDNPKQWELCIKNKLQIS